MKKALMCAAVAAVGLAACSSADNKPEQEAMTGMANPASEFCVKQGGKLEVKKDAQGNEYALCHLPDGKVVEEWEYFRANAK